VLASVFALVISSRALGADLESGLDSLAASLAKGLREKGVHRLAVVEFTDIRGYASALDPFLAEELTTRLFALDRNFRIAERRQLQRVLEEQKLTASALFDESTIAAVGKALGIQAIVTGSISDLGSEVRVNARAISVDTAQVFAAAAVSLPMEGGVEHLVRQPAPSEVSSSTRGVPGASRPAQPSGSVYQNRNLRVAVTSLSLDQGQRRAVVVVDLENLSTEDLLVAHSRDGVLTDSDGSVYELRSVTGLNRRWGKRTFDGDEGCDNDPCTELRARERTTVQLFFDASRSGLHGAGSVRDGGRATRAPARNSGRLYAVSFELVVHDSSGWKTVAVGIPSVRGTT